MRTNSRLSRVLHALLHMEHADGPLTSEAIAEMLCTNPVVVRRLLAGLRWVISVALDDITLLDVYRGAGEPALFSDLVTEDDPQCLVEQAVNAHLSATVREAEQALLEKFSKVTLGELSRSIKAKGLRMHPRR
jgi:DNA-binding IscR family transcriptional regulator